MRTAPAGRFALALLTCAGAASAQELQAFRTRADFGLDVAWVDPTNGNATSLAGGGIPPTFGYSSGTGSVDRRGQRLFTTVQRSGETNWRVYSVSLRDGAVLSNPPIPGTGTSSFFGVEYDEAEGVLYGMRPRATARAACAGSTPRPAS